MGMSSETWIYVFESLVLTVSGSVVLTDIVGIQKRGYYQSINYSIYGAGSA